MYYKQKQSLEIDSTFGEYSVFRGKIMKNNDPQMQYKCMLRNVLVMAVVAGTLIVLEVNPFVYTVYSDDDVVLLR